MRTSEERHYAAVDAFWARLMASGSVYKGTHEGWYSVSDECFYSEQQIERGEDGKMIATETGNEVVWQQEENWKFRLGDYKDQLKEWLQRDEGEFFLRGWAVSWVTSAYEDTPWVRTTTDRTAVHPWPMHAAIARQVDGMGELSISRPASRVKWGVPVPGDPDQTIYVWVDALINYLTVAGFPGEMKAWPVDMHVVGKDIIRFHALHWPALLSAAKLPLPKRVLAHAHWTMGNSKMSKSKGNVVDPIAAMDYYGPDAVRWYLMRSGGSLEGDSDYSSGELSKAHAKLGAQLGNLVQRILAPKLLSNVGETFERDADMDATLSSLPEAIEKRFEGYELTAAVGTLEAALADANRFFSDNEPWTKDDTTREIAYAYATLRNVGILSRPIIPGKSEELLDRLGVPADERGWKDAQWDGQLDVKQMKQRLEVAGKKFKGTTLFPRIEDKDKIDKEAKKEKERQLKEMQRAMAKREKEKKKAERRAREAKKQE